MGGGHLKPSTTHLVIHAICHKKSGQICEGHDIVYEFGA